MSSCRRSAARGFLVLFAFVLSGSSFARAQPQRGLEELERELRTKHRDILVKLLRGMVPADDKVAEHRDAMNTQTEYLTRRFVDPIFQNTPPGSTERTKTMTYLIEQAHLDIGEFMKYKADNQPAAKMYTHYFCLHAKAVILTDPKRTPHSSLNLMRALANLAVLGQGELGETLADLIDDDLKKDQIPEAERLKDPEKLPNDGVKYYALRGLQVLLAQPAGLDPLLTKEQEQKVVNVLLRLINTSRTFKDGTLQPEIDGFRVRRREAVKALAQLGKPSLPNKKDGVAMTLLRVVARDPKLTPEPSPDERLEAAIGLARLKFDQDKDYNPDYAAYHIGLFLNEFVTFCNTENVLLQRPVRIDASRFIEALGILKAQVNEGPKRTEAEKTYANSAIDKCLLVLAKLEKSPAGKVEKTGYPLEGFADQKPPSTDLFKGVAGTSAAPPTKKE